MEARLAKNEHVYQDTNAVHRAPNAQGESTMTKALIALLKAWANKQLRKIRL